MTDQLDAFRQYDFDGNEAWRAYRLNLEIPPGKEALLDKFRAKWYKREVDPGFDLDLVKASLPQPSATAEPGLGSRRPPPSSYVPPSPQPQAAPPAQGASSQMPPRQQPQQPPSAGGAPTGARAGKIGELTLLAAHIVLILSAILSLQPFNRQLGWQAYYLCCRTSLVASVYKIYLRFGLPRLRPFPAALTPWLQQASASSEFFHFLLSTLMLQSPQLWMGVVPLGLLAAYPALATLGTRFGGHPLWQRYGSRAQAWLERNKPSVLRFTATTEVAMGFQLLLAILQSGLRGAFLAYVLWNHLRMRYWAPDSRPYHTQVWASINARIQPLLVAVPALRRYLDYPIRWFQQPGQQQQQQRRE